MAAKKDTRVKKKELEKKIKKAVPVIEVKPVSRPQREAPKQEVNTEEFFVGLHNSLDVRRNILESSRDMIHTLQSYQKISEVREEKFRRVQQFKTVMEELKLLTNKLNKALPKVQIKEVETRAKETFEKKQRAPKVEVSSKSSISDLEKLEEELSKIEGRLSRLD
jgi:hypothetical protein